MDVEACRVCERGLIADEVEDGMIILRHKVLLFSHNLN